jgi:anti-sigma factor RsiW
MEIRYAPRNHPLAEPSNSWSDWTRTVISCHQLIEFCLDYVEGVLPDDEQQRFRRHLSLCPDCVRFFETYRRTPEVSREALKAQMPESVRESVRSYLRTLRDDT